jgi:hypothetical protein
MKGGIMDEARMIERAKTNWKCWQGLRETEPDLAEWMEAHRADCRYVNPSTGVLDRHEPELDAPFAIYRLRPDYEPERWWFHELTGKVRSESQTLNGWLEVTDEYADYLRNKPEGEWELRRVVAGDNYFDIYGRELFRRTGVDDFGPEDRGYRWCKPRVDIEALRREMNAALAAVNKAERAHTLAYQRYMAALDGGAQ